MDFKINEIIDNVLEKTSIQKQTIAKEIGMTRQGFDNALKKNNIPVLTLIKLSEYLNIPITDFFSDVKSLEIEELKNEIKDLQERLKDKNLINDLYQNKTDMLLSLVGLLLSEIYHIGNKHNLDLKSEIETLQPYKLINKFMHTFSTELKEVQGQRLEKTKEAWNNRENK